MPRRRPRRVPPPCGGLQAAPRAAAVQAAARSPGQSYAAVRIPRRPAARPAGTSPLPICQRKRGPAPEDGQPLRGARQGAAGSGATDAARLRGAPPRPGRPTRDQDAPARPRPRRVHRGRHPRPDAVPWTEVVPRQLVQRAQKDPLRQHPSQAQPQEPSRLPVADRERDGQRRSHVQEPPAGPRPGDVQHGRQGRPARRPLPVHP